MDLVWLAVSQWEHKEDLLHGFLGRRGGKSQGVYGSLNLSFRVGDNPQLVKDNLCDMKKAVGLHDLRIVTMKQMHGDHIVEVKDKDLKEAGEADGMVTEESELFLGVLTADCVPILYLVPGRKLVAVAHAGWRGTLTGIGPKMVRHLKARYAVEPASLEVAMGPAIAPCCYEVHSDVSTPLLGKWGSLTEGALQIRANKKYLDLRKMNEMLLRDAGVPPAQIFTVGPCTSCAPGDFFSYRHAGGETGRQMSFIGWQ